MDWFIETTHHGNMRETQTAVIIFYNTNQKDVGTPAYGAVTGKIEMSRFVYSNAEGMQSREIPFAPSLNMQSWVDAAIEYHAFNGRNVWEKYSDFILSPAKPSVPNPLNPRPAPTQNRLNAVSGRHN